MAATLTTGNKPLASPITGVAFMAFQSLKTTHHRGTSRGHRMLIRLRRTMSLHASEMDDDTSNTAHVGTLPVPSQIHQLASILYNILSNDREANAAILEKIETDQADLATDPCQIFTAEDLAHLASHLATTAQTLSQHALRLQMEALSDIED